MRGATSIALLRPAVCVSVQEAADRLRAERDEWDAGQEARDKTLARAQAIAEREEALRRDVARLESKVFHPRLTIHSVSDPLRSLHMYIYHTACICSQA